MGDEDRLDGGVRIKEAGDLIGVGGGAPLELVANNLGAVRLGDRGEAVAEHADGDGEDAIAGAERVDDGSFETAGSGSRDREHIGRDAEDPVQSLGDALDDGRELRSTVIHHGPANGFEDIVGARGRSRMRRFTALPKAVSS